MSGVVAAAITAGVHSVAAPAGGATSRVTGWLDSTNPATVPTITSANTPATPTGTTGTRERAAGASTTARTRRTHSHALTSPASAATGSRQAAGHVLNTLPKPVMDRKVRTATPATGHETGPRHQLDRIAPPATSTASISTTGTATKNNHDSETTAIANINPTQGASNNDTTTT